MKVYLIEDYDIPDTRKTVATLVPQKLHEMLDDLVGGGALDEVHDALKEKLESGYSGWIGKGMLLRIIELE